MNKKRFSWGIREKLTLLFFGVTFVAVFTNFLIVVPRLESQLRGNQLREMRRAAQLYGPLIQQYEQFDSQLTAFDTAATWLAANNIAQRAGARVAILKPTGNPNPSAPQMQVFADTSGLASFPGQVDDWVARRTIERGRAASGLVEVSGRLHTEAAIPITSNGQTIAAAVFSTSLSSVSSIVKQQARRNLIAGVFALGISLMVGLVASNFIARRIKRLERAARAVAAGNFTEPLAIDSGDELGQLAQAFNNMQERLGRADHARKAFIANASHELRTPLFSLGGYVELMRD
ncbi:MAG: HAMP domain-containing protein, partial [Thermoleophilia bacterium]|nr:HAMP domain-containing protein [Thermoleophilia bacterium]